MATLVPLSWATVSRSRPLVVLALLIAFPAIVMVPLRWLLP
jgi:hypothetical protein